MKRKKSRQIAAILGLLLLVIITSRVLGSKGEEQELIKKTKKVSVVNVGDFQKTQANIFSIGKVEALDQVEMRSQLSSEVIKVNVKIGDEVKKGDLLVELDHSSLDAQLSQSGAMISRTQSSVDKVNAGASEEQINQVKRSVDQARASLEQVKVSNEVMISNAENRLALSKTGLENTGEQTVQALENSYNALRINSSAYLSKVKTALTMMGNIIGEEPGENSLGLISDTLLGVKKIQTKQASESLFKSLRSKYESVETLSLAMNENSSNEELESFAEQIEVVLFDCKKTLDQFRVMLDNTVTDVRFTDADLSSTKAGIDGQIAIISGAKMGLEADMQKVSGSKLSSSSSDDVNQINYQKAKDDLELVKRQAQVNFESAKSVLAIQEAALDALIAGPRDVDVSGLKSAVREAQASYRLVSSNREKAFIRAPFDGVISSVPVRLHGLVSPGSVMVSMVNDGGMQIKSYINDRDRKFIKEGSEVAIEGDIEGVVSRISPSIDPVTKKVEIIIVVSNPEAQLTIGQFAESKVAISEELLGDDLYFLPLQSVKVGSKTSQVFTVNNEGLVEAKEVKLGRVVDDSIEILSGLDSDESIVYSVRGLKIGDKVEIK